MSEIIIPSNQVDTNQPLFAAFGLSEAQSNAVYFAITQDIIPVKKTVAECLVAIAERKGWSEKQKMWAAYHLKTELAAAKGVPRFLLDRLEGF